MVEAGSGAIQVLGHDGQLGIPAEWGRSGQHFVEDGSNRVQIGALVAALAFDLFRGHVIGRAHRGAQVGVGHAVRAFGQRQAKIHDDRLAFGGDQDILGFKVAVDNAIRMAISHPGSNFLN